MFQIDQQPRAIDLLMCLVVSLVMNSVAAGADLPATPTTKAGWLNSKPLDFNKLKGKVVVLIFYEEL